jgi:hypothetical protein
MCEMLLFGRNNSHPDPIKDRRGCYKAGMPVVVFQDGHHWGREEALFQWVSDMRNPAEWPNHFILAKFPERDAADLRKFCEVQRTTDFGIILPRHEHWRRREWMVDFALLPVKARASILAKREFSLTGNSGWLAFDLSLVRVSDGTPYRTYFDPLRKANG